MKKLILTGLAAASLTALIAPSAAMAGDEDDARVAIAAAKAKLDSAEKAGVGGQAGDVLSRSRTTLEGAAIKFHKHDDRAAKALAYEAEALADLATATSELRSIESERSKVAVN